MLNIVSNLNEVHKNKQNVLFILKLNQLSSFVFLIYFMSLHDFYVFSSVKSEDRKGLQVLATLYNVHSFKVPGYFLHGCWYRGGKGCCNIYKLEGMLVFSTEGCREAVLNDL
jgi:hypothetical protein